MHLHYSLNKFTIKKWYILNKCAISSSTIITMNTEAFEITHPYEVLQHKQICTNTWQKSSQGAAFTLVNWRTSFSKMPDCSVTFTQVRELLQKLSLHKYKSQNKCQDKVFRMFQKSICIRTKGIFFLAVRLLFKVYELQCSDNDILWGLLLSMSNRLPRLIFPVFLSQTSLTTFLLSSFHYTFPISTIKLQSINS